ncbi:MAG: outer membrane beta-barrel protein [Flavobacteriaceae bacterium]
MNTFKFCLIFIAFLFSGIVFSQNYKNGTLKDINENTYSGKFSIDHDNNLLRYRSGQSSRVFGYSQIKTLTIDGYDVIVKQIDNQNTLLTTLVKGKATLYQKNNSLFYINRENASWIPIETSENKMIIPGTLNLAFKDCSPLRETIARTSTFNKNSLINLTEAYNNCDYSNEFELTEKEITQSSRFLSDVFWLYAGVGASINNLVFSNTEQSVLVPQMSLGVLASPGFLGNLQDKLFVGSDISYGVASTQTLNSSTQSLDVRVHSFLYTLEMQYNFNTSNRFEPFVGVGVNLHSDRFKGSLDGERFNSRDSDFNFNLKAGIMYEIGKQRLGLSFRYIPEYTSDASFLNSLGELVPLDFKNNYFITRVEFHF